MAKRFNEAQFNSLKKLISKHQTLTQKEIAKLFGCSDTTVSLVNVSEDFAHYKEKRKAYRQTRKKTEEKTEIELQENIKDDDKNTENASSIDYSLQMSKMFNEFQDELCQALNTMNQIITLIIERTKNI